MSTHPPGTVLSFAPRPRRPGSVAVKLLDAGGSHDPAVARAIHAHLREQFIAQQAREVYGDARPMPSRERILRPLRRWAIRHEAGLIVAAIFGAALVIGLVVPW